MASAIQGISNLAQSAGASIPSLGIPAAGGTEAAPFSDLLSDAVGQVDSLEKQAQSAATALMTGTGVDVHTAMIATEKASMAFELSLAVRNKAVQAYQQVMSMQF
ncbi:MAG TPA: flagellar hook-basal body complex protein FliE [Terracidiphilus sp.]|jgi:flagellar hook-basal body complex protein FliE